MGSERTQETTTTGSSTGGGMSLDQIFVSPETKEQQQARNAFLQALGLVTGAGKGQAGLGNAITGQVSRMLQEQKLLPSSLDIAGFQQGGVGGQQQAFIKAQGDALVQPGIDQARAELNDLLRDEGEANLASVGASGLSTSLAGNRGAASRGRGGLAYSNILNNAANTRAGLSFRIGDSLQAGRQGNLAALGSLAGIGGQLFGGQAAAGAQAGGLGLQNLGRLQDFQLATADRTRSFNTFQDQTEDSRTTQKNYDPFGQLTTLAALGFGGYDIFANG